MSVGLQKILRELVSNFATYYSDGEDKNEPYWWGHDTNLGDQEEAFKKAERDIDAFKRKHAQGRPERRFRGEPLRIPTYRRDAIARGIFGKNIPAYWRGSVAEDILLRQIKDIKGFKS